MPVAWSQVRLLASGLSSEAENLSFQALNCSLPAARYFVKEVKDPGRVGGHGSGRGTRAGSGDTGRVGGHGSLDLS
jgi:hypothetical protein